MVLRPISEVDFDLLVDGDFFDRFTVSQDDEIDVSGSSIGLGDEVPVYNHSHSGRDGSITYSFDGGVVRRTGSNPNLTIAPEQNGALQPITKIEVVCRGSSSGPSVRGELPSGESFRPEPAENNGSWVFKRGVDFPVDTRIDTVRAGGGVSRLGVTAYSTYGTDFDFIRGRFDGGPNDSIDMTSEDEDWLEVDRVKYDVSMSGTTWRDHEPGFELIDAEGNVVHSESETTNLESQGEIPINGFSEFNPTGSFSDYEVALAGMFGQWTRYTVDGHTISEYQDVSYPNFSDPDRSTDIGWEDAQKVRYEGAVLRGNGQDEITFRLEDSEGGVIIEETQDGGERDENWTFEGEASCDGVGTMFIETDETRTGSVAEEAKVVLKGYN